MKKRLISAALAFMTAVLAANSTAVSAIGNRGSWEDSYSKFTHTPELIEILGRTENIRYKLDDLWVIEKADPRSVEFRGLEALQDLFSVTFDSAPDDIKVALPLLKPNFWRICSKRSRFSKKIGILK